LNIDQCFSYHLLTVHITRIKLSIRSDTTRPVELKAGITGGVCVGVEVGVSAGVPVGGNVGVGVSVVVGVAVGVFVGAGMKAPSSRMLFSPTS
jgi:hypothetical protein